MHDACLYLWERARPIRYTRTDRQASAFCTSPARIGVCKASNIWLAEAFDLYARPIKYRLNFNALDPAVRAALAFTYIIRFCTRMNARVQVYRTRASVRRGTKRITGSDYVDRLMSIHLRTYRQEHNMGLRSRYCLPSLRRPDAIRSREKWPS